MRRQDTDRLMPGGGSRSARRPVARASSDAPAGAATGTVSLLFTDIEASTRQWEESAEMSARVEHHFDVLRAAVGAAGGSVFATMGDGIAAAFPSVDGAVRAAVAAQRTMPSTGLSVRMGVHTGEVERIGHDYRGRAVNRAARIMAAGHGGQILVSDVAAALVRSGPNPVSLVDLGVHRLRDLTEPERIWQVTHPDLPSRFPPARGVDSYANNLPAQRSSLVGRQLDVQRVVELVGHHRLVTLTGVGGVGKTRLAVHAAAELLHQVTDTWFVELAGVTDPGDVADAFAVTLGAASVPDPTAAVTALLGGGPTLLVIDNCEHVVDSVAEVVDHIVAVCPGVTVIATSREPLGVDGEQVLAVRPLDADSAIELFRQRAGAAGADLGPVPADDIGDLCGRLEGIPLAIELAAARSRRSVWTRSCAPSMATWPCSTPVADVATSATARCGRRSSGRTACWIRPSSACSSGCRCSAAPSSTPSPTSPRRWASTKRRRPGSSSRS